MTDLGPDTVGRLEAAASRRQGESDCLRLSGQRLGAVYLLGYSIEIRLKTAYFRVRRFNSADLIDRTDRELVEKQGRLMHLMDSGAHDLTGWARMLVHARDDQRRPMGRVLREEMLRLVAEAASVWSPELRYRAVVLGADDENRVVAAAEWLRDNYSQLH